MDRQGPWDGNKKYIMGLLSMNYKKSSCHFLAFFLLGASSVSMAATEAITQSDYYVDLGLGAAMSNASNGSSDAALFSPNSFSKGGVGFTGDAGIPLNKNFSAEMGFSYLTSASMNIGMPNTSYTRAANINYDSSVNILDLALKGTLPLNNQFDVFAKLGPALVVTNEDVSIKTSMGSRSGSGTTRTAALYYALGGEYAINQNFGLNVEVTGITNSKTDPDAQTLASKLSQESGLKVSFPQNPRLMLLSAGLQYRFD